MDLAHIIEDLLRILTDHGVSIRQDAMGGGGGGLCDIKGKLVFFYDTDSSSFDAAVSCAYATKQVIQDLEAIYLKPAVRDFIDKYVRTR
ncbi:MAG: hypothetical protein LLF76_08365 [Planctomycetaceae bacterium]|nr:hypothetical protein [Planctomycetaceae bacterium]